MLLLRILFCLALAAPSSAETAVYHSPNDDGAPGPTLVPPSGTQSVYLYVDGGAVASAGGTACDEGQGDEVCGFDLEITPQFGLTFGAFNAEVGADLVVNFDATSLRMQELAETLGLAQSTVTRLVAPLKRMGLLDRRPDRNDGRATRAFLTEKGTEAVDQLEARERDLYAELVALLPETRRGEVIAAIELLHEAVRDITID